VINSLSPLVVIVISVPLLSSQIRSVQIIAGLVGTAGVALLVLRSDARLDAVGLIAMAGAMIMFSVATVLTKRWGRPEGMTSVGVTGWTFLFAGLTLLPITLIIEGLSRDLTARNVAGLIYLVVISGIVAYAIWFWGLERLSASAVTFLTLLNPVTAALLGWVVLDQRLNSWQIVGALLILFSVTLGQPGAIDRLRRQRSVIRSRV
jgi:probable blue pigment (indigoidine) exporter